MRWSQIVLETRTYEVNYIVEAPSKQEAEDKIGAGDTISEEELRLESVLSREPFGQLRKVR